MEYLVYLTDVGMQVFQDEEEVGMQVFQDEEEVRMERLVYVGIEEEEGEEEEDDDVGNHVRKEHVPYCVNNKESVLLLVNEIYMLVLL
jgi:hypothetical protein